MGSVVGLCAVTNIRCRVRRREGGCKEIGGPSSRELVKCPSTFAVLGSREVAVLFAIVVLRMAS